MKAASHRITHNGNVHKGDHINVNNDCHGIQDDVLTPLRYITYKLVSSCVPRVANPPSSGGYGSSISKVVRKAPGARRTDSSTADATPS